MYLRQWDNVQFNLSRWGERQNQIKSNYSKQPPFEMGGKSPMKSLVYMWVNKNVRAYVITYMIKANKSFSLNQ